MNLIDWIREKFGHIHTNNKIHYVSEAYNLREIVNLHRHIVLQSNGLQMFEHIRNGDDTFFRAIGPVLRFGQIFNFLPIQNLLSDDVSNITFRWISLLSARCVLCTALGLIEFILYLKEFNNLSLTLEQFSTSAFFASNLIGMLCFFWAAHIWNKLMKCWANLEEVFLYPPYKRCKYTLKLKIRCVSFVFLFSLFVDHFLFTAQNLYFNYMKHKLCDEITEDFSEYMFMQFKRHIYTIFGFNYILAIGCEWLTLSMVVSWNFLDLIIILFSIGITERFGQFMERLESVRNKNMPQSFWTECRGHYNRLQEMVNLVNDNFGLIILLVCFNNVYFLCIKFYSSIRMAEFPFVINQIHFIFSFVLSIGKFVGLLLTAAKINEFSVKPFSVVRGIPSESWNSETERFLIQLQNECVALTGCKLFYITKKFILGMTGTIITYEMIVMDTLTVKPALSESGIC